MSILVARVEHGQNKEDFEQMATKKAASEEKREKAVFSVKIDSEVLKRWRFYASMDGYGDKGKLTEEALKEYMENHELPPEQKKKLKTLMEL